MNNRQVLFVHDGPLYTTSNGDVYGIHFNNPLVERYRSLGHKVCFMMRSLPMPKGKKANLSRIDAPYFSFVSVPDFKSIRSYYRIRTAKKIICQSVAAADVVVVRLPSATGNITMQVARQLNKPCLVEFVACTFDAYWNYDWRGKLIAHYKLERQRRIMQQATHTIYVTDHFLQQRYPSRGKWVGCSDVMLQPAHANALEQRLRSINEKGSEGVLTLGTIAALDVPYKGQADVIKALYILKNKGHRIRYELVGQGNPERLQQLIDKLGLGADVIIRGPLQHSEVFPFLESIDLYLQPSKQEGLPRALVEAMSRACPAMGTNVAGIPELLSNDCLFAAGKPAAIATRLLQVNAGWLAEQASNNFKKAAFYETSVLEQRRNNFLQTFLADSGLSQ